MQTLESWKFEQTKLGDDYFGGTSVATRSGEDNSVTPSTTMEGGGHAESRVDKVKLPRVWCGHK